jgi:hypothetical protein
LSALIEIPIKSDFNELAAFQRRMIKYENYLFTFLFNPEVPPDNNGSERAIRNIKVKHKISGYFKSFKGAFQFAILRSVLDTALKNRQNILGAFTQIFFRALLWLISYKPATVSFKAMTNIVVRCLTRERVLDFSFLMAFCFSVWFLAIIFFLFSVL